MKKLVTISLFGFFSISNIYSQNILSFIISPPNPTTADSISIIIENEFNTGNCDGNASLDGITGTQIYASGIHCQGMLQFICTDYDTLKLAPLSAGQYTFHYSLFTGNTIPCNPGITPADTDSVEFTVTGTNHIKNNLNTSTFQVSPNPASGYFEVIQPENELSHLIIFSLEGKTVLSKVLTTSRTFINTPIASGIYLLTLQNRKEKFHFKLQIIE